MAPIPGETLSRLSRVGGEVEVSAVLPTAKTRWSESADNRSILATGIGTLTQRNVAGRFESALSAWDNGRLKPCSVRPATAS